MRRSKRAQGGTKNWYPQLGANLNGAEFGSTFPGTFGTDYTYPTSAELDYYKSKHLKLIRLTCRWERLQPTLSSALNAAELARLDAVVSGAAARGMQVIPEITNFGGYGNAINPTNKIGGGTVTQAQFVDFWTRMATHYAGNPGIYGYGLMGEPVAMPFGAWPAAAQAAINGIRTVDTKTTIMCSGDNSSAAGLWNQAPSNVGGKAQGGNSTFLLTDPVGNNNLVYEAHCYFDSDMSGSYAESYATEITNGMSASVGSIRANIFINWCKTNGVRGYFGEFGIPNADTNWIAVLDDFLHALTKGGMTGTVWGGGPWWGDAYTLGIEPTPVNSLLLGIGNQALNGGSVSGAVVGTLGSGGALPTGWTVLNQGTLVLAVAGSGVDPTYGPYVDIHFSGTTSTTSTDIVLGSYLSTGLVQVIAGNNDVISVFASLQAGAITNVTGVVINADTANSSFSYVNTIASSPLTPTPTPSAAQTTGAPSATAVWASMYAQMLWASSSSAINATIRFAGFSYKHVIADRADMATVQKYCSIAGQAPP